MKKTILGISFLIMAAFAGCKSQEILAGGT